MHFFKAKISKGLLTFILALYGFIFWSIINQNSSIKLLLGIALLILSLVFTLHLFFSTKYLVSEGNLFIKCGIFYNSKLDIQRIKSISQTRSPIASPAPSFDRIEIHYDKYSSVIISPKEQASFVKTLIKINPAIVFKSRK